ncbi:hypothetical protein Esti_005235 [Eimeria stiedai]
MPSNTEPLNHNTDTNSTSTALYGNGSSLAEGTDTYNEGFDHDTGIAAELRYMATSDSNSTICAGGQCRAGETGTFSVSGDVAGTTGATARALNALPGEQVVVPPRFAAPDVAYDPTPVRAIRSDIPLFYSVESSPPRYLAPINTETVTVQDTEDEPATTRTLGKTKGSSYSSVPMMQAAPVLQMVVEPAPMMAAPTKAAPAPMMMAAPTKAAPAPMMMAAAPTKAAPAPMMAAAPTKAAPAPMMMAAAPTKASPAPMMVETRRVATAPVVLEAHSKGAPAPMMMSAPTVAPSTVVLAAAPSKGRYLAAVEEAETYEEAQSEEGAAERGLGKRKKAVYVAEPVKKAPIIEYAPPPIMMAAPTKKAAPMMMAAPTKKAPPMMMAAPTKKGRYLAAEDETESFEESQSEEGAAERGLGKRKAVYVAEPVKKAPIIEYAPPPIMMAAPTKKAPPMMMAAPTKKGRYLAAEDETESFEETQGEEGAAERGLGKRKAVYVAEPVKKAPIIEYAPPPIMMAAPTKKAPPMMMAAPTKKGRYLAAEDETESFEESQSEEGAAERGLGKRKAVYVAEPVKKAPIIEYAPPPIMMAAPTKKAPPIMMAAPTKKGRYLAAEDETESFEETQGEEGAAERGLGKRKAVYVAEPVKKAPIVEYAPPPIMMAAPTKKAAPMMMAAPTKKGRYLAAEDDETESFEETEDDEPAATRTLGKKKGSSYSSVPMMKAAPVLQMVVEPAPMMMAAAPTKAAPAPMMMAPTKAAPAPMMMAAAPTKASPAPMMVETRSVATAPVVLEAHSKGAPAPMMMSAPTVAPSTVVLAAAPSKGRYLAAVEEAETYEEAQSEEGAAERGLGKRKKAVYVAEPVKKAPIIEYAPPPIMMAAPTKKAAPMMMAAPTKKAAPMMMAAPTKKGRYLAAEDETESFEEIEDDEPAAARTLGKKKTYSPGPVMAAAPVVRTVAAPMVVEAAPMMMAAPTKAAPAPMMMAAAPTKDAPAPMMMAAAPTKAAPAPMMMAAAPTKAAPSPMMMAAAPTKGSPAPMMVETRTLAVPVVQAQSNGTPAMMVEASTLAAPVILEADSKTATAPMMMEAPTVAPATVVLEAPATKGRYLAAVDVEAETYEETQADSATERGLGKRKKAVYVAEPIKMAPIVEYAPPPVMMAAPTKKAAPMMMAAPTKAPPPAPMMIAAPSKKGRYLAAMEMIEV